MIVSKKSSLHGMLLVITDSEILGKKFEEGKLQLDLSKKFYQGEEMNKEKVKDLIPEARYIHATGKEAVGTLVEEDIVESDKILHVQNIPHAEVVMGE